MTKTAVVVAEPEAKPEVPSLDQQIVDLLAAPEGHPSAFFGLCAYSVKRAIEVAEQEAREALARSLDPSVLDATAVGKAHDAEHRVKRLTIALERLEARERTASRNEKRQAWEAEIAPLEARVKAVAEELKTGYVELAGKLADLLGRVVAIDKLVVAKNYEAGDDLRRLYKVEDLLHIATAKITERVKLPAFVNDTTAADIWPLPTRTIAMEYAESVAAMFRLALPPPTEAERQSESDRLIEYYRSMEAGRELKNAETHARADAAAAERRRLEAGELH